MSIFGIGTHGNVRIAQGLDYENFKSLAMSANDPVAGKGGEIGGRAVRLTKDGAGIATTRSEGTGGDARASQIARARAAFLDAVESRFGIGARLKAQEMMDADGKGKPLTARAIKAIDEEINPYTHSLKPTHFVASQRGVFDRAMQDAVVSAMNARPGVIVNVDSVKIEARVVELLKKETFPMNQPGLVRAVAQAVAETLAEATGAKGEEASAIRDAALAGVGKSAKEVPLPKIRSQAEFVTFFRSLSVTAQHGYVVEDEKAPDANGQEKRTFTYRGFVFRSDDRGPGHKTMKRGFTSQNDLSIPENRTEAMGLGIVVDGKAGGWGATGKSGVSCAKTVDGAINYLNPGGTFYVIDTTKLPAGEKAWDMESALYENGYKERPQAPVKHDDDEDSGAIHLLGAAPEPVPLDETNGEVNVSRIPRGAIVGWVTFKGRRVDDVGGPAHDRLDSMQHRIDWDNDYTIQFNPDYKA